MKPSFFVPEVVQTSNMDCGPASLSALLGGLGLPVSYARLREICQTDVDGTSVDDLESTLVALGVDAEQVVSPFDHVLLPEAKILPALAVISLPSGVTHFVVVWRRHGDWIQVMDPAVGRRWMRSRTFQRWLYRHEMAVPAAAWRSWAEEDDFAAPLAARLSALGIAPGPLWAEALAEPGWQAIGALDAATRMVTSLMREEALERRDAGAMVQTLSRAAREDRTLIPERLWMVAPPRSRLSTPVSAEPAPESSGDTSPDTSRDTLADTSADTSRASPALHEDAPEEPDEPQVLIRGAVLVRVKTPEVREVREIPPRMQAALAQAPSMPWRRLLELIGADGVRPLLLFVLAVMLPVPFTLISLLVLDGLLAAGDELATPIQRGGGLFFVVWLMFAGALAELPGLLGALWVGRRLEARLRLAFLRRLPRLPDRFFESRLRSDLAERSHSLHIIRGFPALVRSAIAVLTTLLGHVLALCWLDPYTLPAAVLTVGLTLAAPLLLHPVLADQDLRMRTHLGALSTFYFDALRGLVALRAHAAEGAVRQIHEERVADWVRAARAALGTGVAALGLEGALGVLGTLLVVLSHLASGGPDGRSLLVVYLAVALPALGHQAAALVLQAPGVRNITLRLMETLDAPLAPGAPEPGEPQSGEPQSGEPQSGEPESGEPELSRKEPAASPRPRGVALSFEAVSVIAGGRPVLSGVNLEIPAGAEVAVVGSSGAGKSTLVGLLLGWQVPADGEVRADGVRLDGAALSALRGATAWVDPAVQLWNRSLIENLRYGQEGPMARGAESLLEAADLRGVLERLPEGLQTRLGEDGGRLSGGEGQRTRLGRALGRPDARLVILDEPFRGLDRTQRGRMLDRARQWWRGATLLCVTHDLEETRRFPRVLVVHDGQVVEDGAPEVLAADPQSRYHALLAAETKVRHGLWEADFWRRLRLVGGRVHEQGPA